MGERLDAGDVPDRLLVLGSLAADKIEEVVLSTERQLFWLLNEAVLASPTRVAILLTLASNCFRNRKCASVCRVIDKPLTVIPTNCQSVALPST